MLFLKSSVLNFKVLVLIWVLRLGVLAYVLKIKFVVHYWLIIENICNKYTSDKINRF